MSYVERHLLPGETLSYRTRLHWKIYLMPVLLDLLVLIPLAIAAYVSSSKLLALVPIGAAVLALVPAWLHRRTSEFAVTNKRVIIKSGLVSARSIEILLPKIEAITVTQSVTGRMFGFGSILVTGSGGTHELFDNIQAPLDFRQAVQAAAG